MKILFAGAAAEAFAELPPIHEKNSSRLDRMLEQHPRMFPVGRRGLMRGYRYFAAGRHLVYYSVNLQEVRITAIIPGVMRRA